MSRTDVHRPAWVKETDPTLRAHFEEVHGCRLSGMCLIDAGERNTYARWGIHVECFRVYKRRRNIYCGCWMCVDQHGRKAKRKRERAEGKRQAREERD